MTMTMTNASPSRMKSKRKQNAARAIAAALALACAPVVALAQSSLAERRAEPPAPVSDVPRKAFVPLDRIAKIGGLRPADSQLRRWEALLMEALAVPEWKSASKIAFIDEISRPYFHAEISPRTGPGFNPPKFVLAGELTPRMRARVQVMKPGLFRADAGVSVWLWLGYEGWEAILREAVTPAKRDAIIGEIARHLMPVAQKSNVDNQYKPLRDAMAELNGRAAVFNDAKGTVPIRARVLTKHLLLESGKRLSAQTNPPIPAFVYNGTYRIMPADEPYLESTEPLE